jgi:acyl carrier protein
MVNEPGVANALRYTEINKTGRYTRAQILEGIRDAVVEIGEHHATGINPRFVKNPDKILPRHSYVNDIGANSLDTVEIVMEFEEGFGLEIPDEDAERLHTVQKTMDYLADRLKKEERLAD